VIEEMDASSWRGVSDEQPADLLRRRLTVAESVTEVSGRLTWGTPKSHQARQVPIPRSLVTLLAEVIAVKSPDYLVFTTWRGKPLRNLNLRRDVFDQPPGTRALRV
jgi:integrase